MTILLFLLHMKKRFCVEGDELDFDVTENRVKVRGAYDRSTRKYFYHSFVDLP